MPDTRVVILSDTHLAEAGRGAGSAQALRPLWRGATRVIFNGDTAENGDPRRRADSDEAVAQLQDLCDADGVRMTLVAGNHDPYITDTHFVRLRGGEVFLTHGDALHFAIAPWAESAGRLTRHHRDVVSEQDAEGLVGIDAKLIAAKQASARQWWDEAYRTEGERGPVTGLGGQLVMGVKALWYWRTEPRRAMDFAARYAPASRFFVFGHLHRAGAWNDPDARGGRGRHVINTGAYRMPCRPRAVVIQGQRLELWPVKYDAAKGHRLGKEPIKRFGLDNPPDADDGADYPAAAAESVVTGPVADRGPQSGPGQINPAASESDKPG